MSPTKERNVVVKKSNNNNNLRKRSTIHHTEELKNYIMELWMQGTSVHVLERLIERKVREMRWQKKMQKSA
tara:strand:+ start:320 stop:532 length:213 start_codon:yes stop_codon:yes gene_type:complete